MSYTFSTVMPEAPLPRALLEGLGLDDLRTLESLDLDAPWPEGYLHVYRWGVSTRSIELHYGEDGGFDVRVLWASTREDHRLAIAIVQRAAILGGTGLVTPEEVAEPVARAEFEAGWGEAWIDGQVEGQLRFLAAIVRREGETITLPGPVGEFHAGPRLVAELEAQQEPASPVERLHAAMRRVQYPGDDVFRASILGVTKKGEDKQTRLVVWSPDVRVLFPRADQVCLHDSEPILLLPYDAIAELAGDRATRIDEYQYIVEPIPDEEWPSLLARAQAYQAG